MMQRFKLVLLALSAVVVLGAAVATVASATPPSFLPVEAPTNFTGKGGKGTLAVLPGGVTHELTATEQAWEGKIEAGKTSGPVHIVFEHVKSWGGLVTCTGLDESSGVILALGTYRLVYDKLGTGSELGVGMLLSIEPTHYECSTKLFVVAGEVLCLLTPLETPTTKVTVKCEGSKGDPGETAYWNEKGEEVKIGEGGLGTSENEGTTEASSWSLEATINTSSEYTLVQTSTGPLFLAVGATKFDGRGGKGILAVLPGGITHELTSAETAWEGEIEEPKTSGPVHIDFKKAASGGGLITCTGLDESSGVILALGTYKLVYDKLGEGAELGVGILYSIAPAHYECSTKLFVLEGELLCLITPLETQTATFTVKCEGSKGDPGETVYWNGKGEEVKMGEDALKTSENEGTGEMSSWNLEAAMEAGKEYVLMG